MIMIVIVIVIMIYFFLLLQLLKNARVKDFLMEEQRRRSREKIFYNYKKVDLTRSTFFVI